MNANRVSGSDATLNADALVAAALDAPDGSALALASGAGMPLMLLPGCNATGCAPVKVGGDIIVANESTERASFRLTLLKLRCRFTRGETDGRRFGQQGGRGLWRGAAITRDLAGKGEGAYGTCAAPPPWRPTPVIDATPAPPCSKDHRGVRRAGDGGARRGLSGSEQIRGKPRKRPPGPFGRIVARTPTAAAVPLSNGVAAARAPLRRAKGGMVVGGRGWGHGKTGAEVKRQRGAPSVEWFEFRQPPPQSYLSNPQPSEPTAANPTTKTTQSAPPASTGPMRPLGDRTRAAWRVVLAWRVVVLWACASWFIPLPTSLCLLGNNVVSNVVVSEELLATKTAMIALFGCSAALFMQRALTASLLRVPVSARPMVGTLTGVTFSLTNMALNMTLLLPLMRFSKRDLTLSQWFVSIGGRYVPMVAFGYMGGRMAQLGASEFEWGMKGGEVFQLCTNTSPKMREHLYHGNNARFAMVA
ncbi:hypothetical protein T492DRAFT_843506 [Pavlovales sp. CCMP2436]|nr:hypothetical protein T492DRAFT_843506 [Pavlovales sp. CCMP2436]